ncbi:MAG: holo-ACP synthase [Rickettsia endosymbiont of Bryobia graminum]|nr:holo-ACP synthase [Rickettsia endosymbiont of Bryobia graminum]
MIIGVGTDIVQILRIERLLNLYQQRFIERILSQPEIQKLSSLNKESYSNFLAKRFAAKEAISKATGRGIGRDFSFKDISILNDELGRPFVKISLYNDYKKFDGLQIHLSISDDYPLALAFAVITQKSL